MPISSLDPRTSDPVVRFHSLSGALVRAALEVMA
jgi:hypothetical protein